jgi:hypothetical protein
MPTKKRWMYVPPKPAKPKVPDDLKPEVQRKADEFIESYLKPTFLLPPPEDPKFNYVTDIFAKWYQRFFYFCSTYRCVHERCISEFYESRFARLEYVGNRRFNVAYFRHTGQWWTILEELTLEECLKEIKEQQLLQP